MIYNGTKKASAYSPLALAFIGDAVYSLYVRSVICEASDEAVHGLHVAAARFVKAKAQCETYHKIEHLLTEEEITYFKRGRNAKSGTVPKNADVTEYRHATGFETLLGYLYVEGKNERLDEILQFCLQ